MINSRDKGQRGERELFALLSDYLGIICKRNISQTREGGSDTLDIPGWSIECKFWKEATEHLIKDAWNQCCEQSRREWRKPMLFYRQNGARRWKAVVDLNTLRPDLFPVAERETATIFFDAACQLIRESICTSSRTSA